MVRTRKGATVTRPILALWSDYSEAKGRWEDVDGGKLRVDSAEVLRGRAECPGDSQGTGALAEDGGQGDRERGSAGSVRRYVARRKTGQGEVFLPLYFGPGEEAQLDWGEATVIHNGVQRKVQLFCMKFCHSHVVFVRAYERANLESFLDGHVENLVKRSQRTFLTPLPEIPDLDTLNAKLAQDCLAERELAARQAKATERRLRQAGFPAAKDLADFDFTAAGLVNAYLEAREQRQVLRLEAHIARCQLLVVDELGYIPLDKLGAEHLFGFFSQCYERTSLKAKKGGAVPKTPTT